MMISLRCEDCLGTMEVDESREVLTCPYCGSKKMLPVSDAVKITKLNNEHEEVMTDKRNTEKNKAILIFFGMMIAVVILGVMLSMLD